jgi:hypothetical protein
MVLTIPSSSQTWRYFQILHLQRQKGEKRRCLPRKGSNTISAICIRMFGSSVAVVKIGTSLVSDAVIEMIFRGQEYVLLA